MNKKFLIAASLAFLFVLIYFGGTAWGVGPSGSPPPGDPEFVPDQVLVRFEPWVNAQRANQILAQRGFARIRSIKALDVNVLQLPPGLSVERAVAIFGNLPEVDFAEPNYILRAVETSTTEAEDQWNLKQIQADQAWGEINSWSDTLVAIVDTGIDRNHPDLAPNIWSNPGEIPDNGVDDDVNGYVDDTWGWDFYNNDKDPIDDFFHGTAVASVAAGAAVWNGNGVTGVCPRCKLLSVKVLGADGSGTEDQVASGIVYAADRGARVINLSLAGNAVSQSMETAVNYAWGEGVLVVAAAGNNGADLRVWPAASENAMAVAATNDQDYRACFSNYGEDYITVAAPGEAIISATPNQSYGTFSGTSLAAPHVAGLAGLLLSQNPNLKIYELWNLIETTVNDLGPQGVDASFGAGRVNALRAVRGDTLPTTPPAGLFTDDSTASGYAHARKLIRDANNNLHLVWHGKEGGMYRVLYATSDDGGTTWIGPEVVFSSSAETFHPALAMGENELYMAFPTKDNSPRYRVFFASKPLPGGDWSDPVPVLGGNYDAVRPDLYYDPDPASRKLHLVASSLDNAPDVYYTSSGNGGGNWSATKTVTVGANTHLSRYAAIHANGTNIYIAGRTVEFTLYGILPRYRVFTIRSLDDGKTWNDLTELAALDGLWTGEYGVSLAGVEDKLYLTYEHNLGIYFRIGDGAVWSTAENIGGGQWPSVSQAPDGEAWVSWDSSGNITIRHYSGTTWDPAEIVGTGNYPNFKLDPNGGLTEWVANHCSGAPFRLTYASQAIGTNDPPSAVANGPSSGTEDIAMAFDGSGSSDPDGNPLSYTWDFGDGSTGTGVAPNHAYAYGGNFTVTLTVNDGKGGTDTDSFNVSITEVNDPPIANANGPYSGFVGTPIIFVASGSFDPDNLDGTPANDQILTYMWDFGDSTTGTGANPSHAYDTALNYDVALTVSDGIVTDTAYTTASVLENNVAPVASFTYICTDLTCDFDGSASADSDGTIVSYSWAFAFGDNNDTGSGETVTHAYAAAGTYTVVLTVTDDEGAQGTDSQDVTVNAPIPTTMHIGDLDESSSNSGKRSWTAIVTVEVHDGNHEVVGGATVSGSWSDGARGTASCMTEVLSGRCMVASKKVPDSKSSAVFTVQNITHGTLIYDMNDNHDPDNDSDGNTIIVYK